MAQKETESSTADSWASVFAQIRKENEDLKKELAEVKSRRNKADQEYARNHPPVVKSDKIEEKPPEPPEKPHFVGWWQKVCPECGEDNPEFKDETVCEGCGAHLGEASKVEKMKACPSCGGKKARLLKELKKDVGAIGEPIQA